MINSKYLNTVLTVIAVLLGLNLWVGVHQSPASAALDLSSPALAQGRVDAGQQRAEMITELKNLSKKVDGLKDTLTSGKVTVQVEGLPKGD